METIEREDLTLILNQYSGNKFLTKALNGLTNNEELLRVLARYVQFNSPFGGGVANLAGEIAVRQDLFRDQKELLGIIADRSVEVASKIFSAAIDEFGDQATPHMDTHRTLAQATLKGAGKFFGYSPAALNNIIWINQATFEAIGKVRNGYLISQSPDEYGIFHAMGFHMGSEILADEEFRMLDSFLREKYPELVYYLQKNEVRIGAVQRATYYWVSRHTTVEAEHFAAAIVGSNVALQYYAGQESLGQIKEWILEGFAEFASVQGEFMEGLRED